MTELALEQRFIDFIGDLSRETGVERRELFKVANRLEYGRLPNPSEAADFLKRAEENIKTGRTKSSEEVKEAIADVRGKIASKA